MERERGEIFKTGHGGRAMHHVVYTSCSQQADSNCNNNIINRVLIYYTQPLSVRVAVFFSISMYLLNVYLQTSDYKSILCVTADYIYYNESFIPGGGSD